MAGRIADLPLLEPADRAAWRSWLHGNHAASPGVWLAVGKKTGTATALRYEDAVQEALCFGWIDSVARRLDEGRFLQLMTPRKPGSGWAPSNKDRVQRLGGAGLLAPAGLAAIQRAKSDGSWTLLDDVEALVVPDDLAAALAAAPSGERAFAALPVSLRKQELYAITTAKRAETRAKRISATVARAVERFDAAP